MKKNVVLCILDGWGIGSPHEDNAIQNAEPKFYNALLAKYPYSTLCTSGYAVGLPEGQMGNSEVGHMTIGSGRVIEQDLVKIDHLIADGTFFEKTHFSGILNDFNISKNYCHLVGLVSDGGVHSHIHHLLAIAKFLNEKQIKTFIHIITDGRDTLPKSGINFVKKLQDFISDMPNIAIATISGRYYAMDRDARYTRTELAYNSIIGGANKTFIDPIEVLESSYAQNITDEFIVPQSTENYSGAKDGDIFIFTNFRADRMRQIVSSLVANEFEHFHRKNIALNVATMTSYSTDIDKYVRVLLANEEIKNTLAETLEKYSMTQLRIAETEKYAHVTFFFNAGKEESYPHEKRILINSPKVATYDTKPEMSAYELTDVAIKEIKANKYNFITINYANADMVGHTGNYDATIQAIKTLDKCLEKLVNVTLQEDGIVLITADHGNAEDMFDHDADSPYTSHTTNPVPLILVGSQFTANNTQLLSGQLSDIAPTILYIFGVDIPKEMTGKILIGNAHVKKKN